MAYTIPADPELDLKGLLDTVSDLVTARIAAMIIYVTGKEAGRPTTN